MIDAARELTLALAGNWNANNHGMARCPAHDDRHPSLSITNGRDGRLLLNCHAGCRFQDIMTALSSLGLIKRGTANTPLNSAEIGNNEKKERTQAARLERKAFSTWCEALPIEGTIAETYLRGRSITCDLPETLRFHPECWHPTARRYPAMIALVEGLHRAAIHRTYLRPDGSGKADVVPAKAMQGATAGGAVRLTQAEGPLVVAEGIETALSLASGLLARPTTIWAALSAPGMTKLHLPEGVRQRLTIASDSDDSGAGCEAALKLAQRAYDLGWSVNLLPAPDGCDWNDVLQAEGAKA